MNTTTELSPAEREFLIRLRGLLLMAVDLIERRAGVGKHKGSVEVTHAPTETIASAVTMETGQEGGS